MKREKQKSDMQKMLEKFHLMYHSWSTQLVPECELFIMQDVAFNPLCCFLEFPVGVSFMPGLSGKFNGP